MGTKLNKAPQDCKHAPKASEIVFILITIKSQKRSFYKKFWNNYQKYLILIIMGFNVLFLNTIKKGKIYALKSFATS